MCSVLQKPCVGAFLSCARYWRSAGSGDLGKGRFCNHIVLRMNVWQEAWPERNCFLDRIIHGQTDGTCSG